MYRLSHPTTEFIPPKPFTIYSSTGHVNVLGGEDVNVTFFTSGVEVPDSLLIEFIPLMFNTNNDSIIITKAIVKDNQYGITLKEVFQNYQYRSYYKSNVFWQPWTEISSKKYSISVTDRQSINDFTANIFSGIMLKVRLDDGEVVGSIDTGFAVPKRSFAGIAEYSL